jgi:hypothetical protein
VALPTSATGERVGAVNGHAGEILIAAFSPDGTHLDTAGREGTRSVRDATRRREDVPLSGSASDRAYVDPGPEGQAVLTLGPEGKRTSRVL